MELLSALLTGFFYWLWQFNSWRNRRARARETAGALLLQVNAARRSILANRWGRIIVSLILLGLVVMQLAVLRMVQSSAFGSSISLVLYFSIAILFSSVLLLASPLSGREIALEVRENGILQGNPGLKFAPWNEIAECRWFLAATKFGLYLCYRIPKPHARSRFTIVENKIAPGQKDGVTAVLARFAPVYDRDGTLLAKPDEAESAARAAKPGQRRSRYVFQFDLQSLMLLFVVVSCAASCYGIHYRRLRPHREAVAKLETFGPQTRYIGDAVWCLDFSKCKNKPSDSDLVYLEPLGELWQLDLSGAPISDAALTHLKGLERLSYIVLTDTRVTSKGAEELQRELPKASIIYGPSAAPRAASSGGRQ